MTHIIKIDHELTLSLESWPIFFFDYADELLSVFPLDKQKKREEETIKAIMSKKPTL